MRNALSRILICLVAGSVTALAFEPAGWWWLLPVTVAALSLAVRDQRPRRGALLGLAYGLGFMVALMPWLRVVGTDAWLGLSLLESLFYALLGWAMARTARLRWWPLAHALLWVSVESLRGVFPFGGFNWGRLAFAVIDAPVAPLVTFVGVAGVTFVVALSGTMLAYAVTLDRRRSAALVVLGTLLALGLTLAIPSWNVPTGAPAKTVAIVQGNVGTGLDAFAERNLVIDNHVSATVRLADEIAVGKRHQPDLVLWPENSSDIDPYRDSAVMGAISAAVNAIDAPTLVGAMVQGPGPHDIENQGIVWLPGVGPTTHYTKMHPVPFGEYIPMRSFLAQHIRRLDQIPRDMVPGKTLGVLDIGGTTLGDVICFEVIYDDLVTGVVRGGAKMIAVQTNNATYMGTGQVDQQFAVSRLRALETHRYMAVAATNGISAFIDPNGKVLQRAPKRTQAELVMDVPQLTTLTPAVRFGRDIERTMALLGWGSVLWTFTPAVRRRIRAAA